MSGVADPCLVSLRTGQFYDFCWLELPFLAIVEAVADALMTVIGVKDPTEDGVGHKAW
jgi:hypothetical protein